LAQVQENNCVIHDLNDLWEPQVEQGQEKTTTFAHRKLRSRQTEPCGQIFWESYGLSCWSHLQILLNHCVSLTGWWLSPRPLKNMKLSWDYYSNFLQFAMLQRVRLLLPMQMHTPSRAKYYSQYMEK
jgi:hypothetical protein